jgi:hypothetical protein
MIFFARQWFGLPPTDFRFHVIQAVVAIRLFPIVKPFVRIIEAVAILQT